METIIQSFIPKATTTYIGSVPSSCYVSLYGYGWWDDQKAHSDWLHFQFAAVADSCNAENWKIPVSAEIQLSATAAHWKCSLLNEP